MDIFLKAPAVDAYVPDGGNLPEALASTTDLAIGAHQDDIEIMSAAGIVAAFGSSERRFSAVVCTGGYGFSPRSGHYCDRSAEEITAIRHSEQRAAAAVGRYSAMIQLLNTSEQARDPKLQSNLIDDIAEIVRLSQPDRVYTHVLADKHETHIGVSVAVVRAMQALTPDERPAQLFGCEVWRSLDWVNDDEKVHLDSAGYDALSSALIGVFDSQISGGKRYDLAAVGRRHANATFGAPRAVDESDQITFAVDMTELMNSDVDLADWMAAYIRRFEDSVRTSLGQYCNGGQA